MPDELALNVLGYASGWALLGLVILMIVRGQLITRREADRMEKVIDKQAEALATKDQTIAAFSESVDINNQLVRAFLEVARERSP